MSLFGSLIKTALAKGARNVADSATPNLTQRVRAQLGGVPAKAKSELPAERLLKSPQEQKTFLPKPDTPSARFENPSITSEVEKGMSGESKLDSFKDLTIKNIPDEAFNSTNLPPASNAQRTQITTTKGTYKKAADILKVGEDSSNSKALDFGAGRGHSADYGFDTYEPFPREDFTPTYTDPSKIPDASYDKITNLNVLNVVPPSIRDVIVKDIGRILKPGGDAIITARSYADVMTTKNKTPVGEKGTAFITGTETYQKGFKPGELSEYVKKILGKSFEVNPVSLGATGVKIKKLNE
tara:strand:- start:43 stop:933 length:891 start_codon:yes stop_codon:yes gene_type:complete